MANTDNKKTSFGYDPEELIRVEKEKAAKKKAKEAEKKASQEGK